MKTRGEVEFNEGEEKANKETYDARRLVLDLRSLSLIHMVKRLRLAKTDTQAQYILIAVGLISIITSIFIISYFIFGIGKNEKVTVITMPTNKTIQTTNPKNQN